MINIFACTCPNRSGVGAIDNPDRFEQVFDPYYILEVLEKFFMHDISMVRRQKMLIFGVLKAFIVGPRHTLNPPTLRTFCHKKSASRKLLTISEKF